MFEGKPLQEATPLQVVSWADLSARLSAARDVARGRSENREGSFDAASARWIADHTTDHPASKLDVNPDYLANFKVSSSIAVPERVPSMPSARLGDRGK
jgi:hypothetical protein